MANVATNGLGRIGRAALKVILDTPELNLVAANESRPRRISLIWCALIPSTGASRSRCDDVRIAECREEMTIDEALSR